jgi:2-succinyl-5-enolpyruvyl-6-hydroxy-3-cyclohexene-1-carboxylate synthase
VIRFGEMPTSKSLRQWLLGGGELRQVIVDPSHGWNDPTKSAATILRADPTLVAAGITAHLAARRAGGFLDDWLAADEAVLEAHNSELSAIGALSEPGLHAALGRAHRSGDVVYTASSMPIRDQEEFVAGGPETVQFLANRGTNGIDGFVSSGIGAAVASGRPTTIVLGDLCLFHDLGGLLALREAEAPVRIVVIDNGGGAIFHFLPQAEALDDGEFEALLGTPTGIEPERVAALFGIEHRPLADLADLEDALGAGTGLISVAIDREQNVEVHKRLRTAARAALGSL